MGRRSSRDPGALPQRLLMVIDPRTSRRRSDRACLSAEFFPIAVVERAAMSGAPAGALRKWRRFMPSIPSRLMNPGRRAWVLQDKAGPARGPSNHGLSRKSVSRIETPYCRRTAARGHLGDVLAGCHCRAHHAARGAPMQITRSASSVSPNLGALPDMTLRRPAAPTAGMPVAVGGLT